MKYLAISILIIIGILSIIPLIKCESSSISEEDPVQNAIDSLFEKKDSLSFELNVVNDSLQKTNEEFISNRDSILNQSVSADYNYFTEYLNRHFNINNTDSAKTN